MKTMNSQRIENLDAEQCVAVGRTFEAWDQQDVEWNKQIIRCKTMKVLTSRLDDDIRPNPLSFEWVGILTEPEDNLHMTWVRSIKNIRPLATDIRVEK